MQFIRFNASMGHFIEAKLSYLTNTHIYEKNSIGVMNTSIKSIYTNINSWWVIVYCCMDKFIVCIKCWVDIQDYVLVSMKQRLLQKSLDLFIVILFCILHMRDDFIRFW